MQRTVHLWLEPWGDEISLLPDKAVEVRAIGPLGDCLAVEQMPSDIALYGWPGSTLRVFDGELLVLDLSIPAPETPPRFAPAP